jgi:hypothetical protein
VCQLGDIGDCFTASGGLCQGSARWLIDVLNLPSCARREAADAGRPPQEDEAAGETLAGESPTGFFGFPVEPSGGESGAAVKGQAR